LKVVVVGAGVMGHGIAEVAALSGFDVVMVDVAEEFLSKGLERIKWSLEKFVEKKRISREQADEAFGRIRTTTNLEDAVAGADLVIEAVPERFEIKKEVFERVSRAAPRHAIIGVEY
jgi:enoyl-CoA hydratase/3-hydroxyacyl-CoA dehydrogenase